MGKNMNILLTTPKPEELKEFVTGLKQESCHPVLAENGEKTLDLISSAKPGLVIVDDRLPDYGALTLIREIVTRDAMINTAVITGMDDSEFHEKSEGLGVFMKLPLKPQAQDARELIQNLKKII